MAIQLCAGLVLSSFITFLGVFAQQLGVSPYWIGMLVSGFGVMGIVSRVLLTPIAARFGDETLLLGILFVIPIVALLLMMLAAPDRLWPLGAGV
ncbi:MFS transporter, partial [Alcaligenes pakistanensis]